MKKSILEIYALAVCFATVVCFVVASGIALYNIIEIAHPEFTMSSYEYNKYKTNDTYWDSISSSECTEKKEKKRPSEQELTKQRTEGYKQAIEGERRSALQSITKTAIVIVLNVLFFLVHWRIAKRSRETNINT